MGEIIMVRTVLRVTEVIEVGPRRVTKVGGRAAVYLGKRLNQLIGKDVIVVVKVIDSRGDGDG